MTLEISHQIKITRNLISIKECNFKGDIVIKHNSIKLFNIREF